MPQLHVDIAPQPNDITCGPTCLHAIYRYWGDPIALGQVVEETRTLPGGGTLEVFLANHALRRGYDATIYTYNLRMFDPSWFAGGVDLAERLRAQAEAKSSSRLRQASRAYVEFLEHGGHVRFQDLTPALIRNHVGRGEPILTGLSATYLYHTPRELPDSNESDDIRGEPVGHFVVLAGYARERREVMVADPYRANPTGRLNYAVDIRRLIGAILLGIVTYDSSLLIVKPPKPATHGRPDRR
jgi:hypothetical protein